MAQEEEASIPDIDFGTRVRLARVKAGMDQAELADKIGAKQGAISKWERNESCPREFVRTCQRIAKATQTPVDWLVFGTNSRSPIIPDLFGPAQGRLFPVRPHNVFDLPVPGVDGGDAALGSAPLARGAM